MLSIFSRIALQLIAPKAAIKTKYEAFKELLQHDRYCHERLAELEELYYHKRRIDLNRVRSLHRKLSDGVSSMISSLNRMSPASCTTLRAYYKKIDFYGRIALTSFKDNRSSSFILSLDEFYKDDLLTGGKGLHLSQVKRQLKLPMPRGFIISTAAYDYFLKTNNLPHEINEILGNVDIKSDKSLFSASEKLMTLLEKAKIPSRLSEQIVNAVSTLPGGTEQTTFAVRSSAVSEDSVFSFAGQYESVLQVRADRILAAYRRVLTGKYASSAIHYRINAGLLEEETPMAVLVQEMITPQLSGVATSGDSTDAANDKIIIHYTQGLGDALVGGRCTPTTILVGRSDDSVTIRQKNLVSSFTPNQEGTRQSDDTQQKPVQILAHKYALQLADWVRKIENLLEQPIEIEWSLDQKNDLYLLQARPILRQNNPGAKADIDTSGFSVLIDGAETASWGSAHGKVYVINDEEQISEVPAGAILVTRDTPPSYALVLDKVRAVVADRGSAADHFSSIAREAGIPLLVGAGNATTLLRNGKEVTVCADFGRVFAGRIDKLLEIYPPRHIAQDTTPVQDAFSRAAQFIFPLRLVNPASPAFTPENCRSLHDIIRYAHEKGLQSMFSQTSGMFPRKSGSTLLETDLPLQIYVLDMDADTDRTVPHSLPLSALLQGLTHPGIKWRHHDHFDWRSFTETTMGGGIVGSDDPLFASYAIVSRDYLNLNMRFGYHFVIVDCLCGYNEEDNYIKLRFAGGGGEPTGITLRLDFVAEILKLLGFSVRTRADLLDGQLTRSNITIIIETLDMLGRLLASTTLMDMVIKDEEMVRRMVTEFMNGKYNFSG